MSLFLLFSEALYRLLLTNILSSSISYNRCYWKYNDDIIVIDIWNLKNKNDDNFKLELKKKSNDDNNNQFA
ncbi:hypothetical protein DERF_005625 [Dermatophagoides farinae]|uniref:Uncharacterized protein n=1 Tax=Dermatophagoides farinae TaxID=6954 RepID=A0A922I607_DERFA|nr:hypothetical protein DERF_005625 [Dermatophagoides farinae]